MTLHPQIVQLLAAVERPDRPGIHKLPIAEARAVYGAMPRFMGDLGFHRAIGGPDHLRAPR